MRETLRKASGAVIDGCEGRTTGKVPVGTSVERNGFLFSRCLTGRPNGGAALTGAKKEFTSRLRSAVPHGRFDSKRIKSQVWTKNCKML